MDVDHLQHRSQHPPHHYPSSSIASDTPPPIPTRTRYNSTNHAASRRRISQHTFTGGVAAKRQSIPPAASPEVISSLITSLSGIAKPADDYFEAATSGTPSPPAPFSSLTRPSSSQRGPSGGSFGVDYGAYSKPRYPELSSPISLDELAASPPIVRTSKPTSGYSPLNASKSPKSSRSASSRDGGLRSFIRSSSSNSPSRPSSKTSAKNDDTHSIGNLSIERPPAPSVDQELNHKRSFDSWGKKTGRSYKGLMYMSSRERLREKEDRKRSMDSNGGAGLTGAKSNQSLSKPDPSLAEMAISEEPAMAHNISPALRQVSASPRSIPNRDSSLKKMNNPTPKRDSGRRSHSNEPRAPSTAPVATASSNTAETPANSGRKRGSVKKSPPQLDLTASSAGHSFLLGPGEAAGSNNVETPTTQRFLDTIRSDYLAFDNHRAGLDATDGAPYPAVAQSRRRSDQSLEHGNRRRSGQNQNKDSATDDGKGKRSSSRLKRLSRPTSPAVDGKTSTDVHRDTDGGAPLERVDSTDSVDDAVEAYLSSPRLTQRIKHPQTGRVICFSEVGDPEGSAVFCCVGMGLTRYITAFYDELALTLKLRLITPDRPGVGESEPYADGSTTPLGWPDDVYAICQALKITKFSILAHSAGAIYALATALRMPQHIRGRIHLLAPWIPPSQMNVFGGSQALPPTHAIPTSQRILRALPTPMLKVANSSFMSATSTSITTSLPKTPRRTKRKSQNRENNSAPTILPPPDKENIGVAVKDAAEMAKKGAETASKRTGAVDRDRNAANGDRGEDMRTQEEIDEDALADAERQQVYDIRLTHAIWGLATTGANPAVDLLVCLERRHTIGFRYVDINRPVIIHHGSKDTRVPVDNVRWLGRSMRRCEVRVLEGEGHGLMASASVMGSVLMEISKEWEEWMRVTGADGRKEKERGRRTGLHR
ncbi:unnamed protein product [Clonostachys rhizophaga]|uniref:AB hydrolase-1 domain-containing protein n=1 Tax=Clonostachys rhizophaga TaxID=160324 RepID=A0A9N9VYZ4_9HYPO|nr:unnamed protein product [Clonostachys rhizophaga]